MPCLQPERWVVVAGECRRACCTCAGLPCLCILTMPCLARPLVCAVSGLQPHRAYTFRVRALNCVGSSVSETDSFRTAPAPPSEPRSLQQQGATPTSLAASWAAPRYDHGAHVAGYQLEWARGARGGALPANSWRPAYQGAATHVQVLGGGRSLMFPALWLQPRQRLCVEQQGASTCASPLPLCSLHRRWTACLRAAATCCACAPATPAVGAPGASRCPAPLRPTCLLRRC